MVRFWKAVKVSGRGSEISSASRGWEICAAEPENGLGRGAARKTVLCALLDLLI